MTATAPTGKRFGIENFDQTANLSSECGQWATRIFFPEYPNDELRLFQDTYFDGPAPVHAEMMLHPCLQMILMLTYI
jgi:hypothetical protein